MPPVEWIAGVVLAILLNVTANWLPTRFQGPLLRWGWFSVLLYFTYLVMPIEFLQRRLSVFGGSSLGSYAIAGLIGAFIAVVYWAVINTAYSKLSHPPQQNSVTEASNNATQVIPSQTEASKAAPSASPSVMPSLSPSPSAPPSKSVSKPRLKNSPANDTEDILHGRKKGPQVK